MLTYTVSIASFGPSAESIVGHKLKRLFKNCEKIKIYGDIKETVNITNVNDVVSKISTILK